MNEKPSRKGNIQTQILPDGHVVLVCEQTNWAYTLNPLGAMVWELCDGTNQSSDIVRAIEEVGIASAVSDLDKEIYALLEEFAESDLVC